MPRFAAWVKSHDMFGHEIKLNFNRNGDSHTTILGGLVSLLVKTVMTIYIYMNIMKLVSFEDAAVETKIKNLDLVELGEVSYHDAKSTVFWVMRKTAGVEKSFYLDKKTEEEEQVDRFLEFSVI